MINPLRIILLPVVVLAFSLGLYAEIAYEGYVCDLTEESNPRSESEGEIGFFFQACSEGLAGSGNGNGDDESALQQADTSQSSQSVKPIPVQVFSSLTVDTRYLSALFECPLSACGHMQAAHYPQRFSRPGFFILYGSLSGYLG